MGEAVKRVRIEKGKKGQQDRVFVRFWDWTDFDEEQEIEFETLAEAANYLAIACTLLSKTVASKEKRMEKINDMVQRVAGNVNSETYE